MSARHNEENSGNTYSVANEVRPAKTAPGRVCSLLSSKSLYTWVSARHTEENLVETHSVANEVRPAKMSSGRVCSSLVFNVLYEES
jgi:hypothetical protein